MRTIFTAVVSVALLSVVAPVHAGEPAARFGGAYIGVNAGAAWGSSRFSTDPGCVLDSANGVFCVVAPDPSVVNGTAVSASGSGRLSSSGFTGGVQGGYNWQRGAIVFGTEADFGAFDLNRSRTVSGSFPFLFLGNAYTLSESVSADWLATVRGRIGFAVMPHLLLYATGGIAFANVSFAASYGDNAVDPTFPGGQGAARDTSVRIGWALGGGVEWLLHGPWSIKAEYLYVDFGSENVAVHLSNTAAFTQTMHVESDLSAHIARAGLNYRF